MWTALLASIDPSQIIGEQQIGPLASAVTVYGVLLVLPALHILASYVMIIRYRRRAVVAEAACDSAATLQAGETTLFGTVEHAQGADRAVRVEVDQHGTEQSDSSGVWTHKWTEVDRRVKVRPFYLRHASGERIRVEPTREVYLVDEMDGVIRASLSERTRFAELTSDEQVYAVGTLTRDFDPEARPGEGGLYRSPPVGHVLRPPRSGPMLLSTEPLYLRFLQRARFHRNSILMLLPCAIVCHLLLLPYHMRVAGHVAEGTITRLDSSTTSDGEGGTTYHHIVTVKVPGIGATRPLENEVPYRVFERLQEGQRIPVRISPVMSADWSCVGPHATVHLMGAIISTVPLVAMMVICLVRLRKRRWYEGPVFDAGRGRLEGSLASKKETITSR